MQAIRRLTTIALWLFVVFWCANGWTGFKATAAFYCATRGGCSEQGISLLTWSHVGLAVAIGIVLQGVILWIFADPKK